MSLKYDCAYREDIWYTPIFSEDDIIDDDFLSTNYCSFNFSSLSRAFCSNCEYNLKKIASNMNKRHTLLSDWDNAYIDDNINLNTIKKIQSYDQWSKDKNLNHPDWYHNHDLRITRNWNGLKVFIFDDYFDSSLDEHIKELKNYDIVVMGWYFKQDIAPLLELKQIKGIVFGYRFNGDISPLKDLPILEFVSVRRSYNRKIHNDIYEKTYFDKMR